MPQTPPPPSPHGALGASSVSITPPSSAIGGARPSRPHAHRLSAKQLRTILELSPDAVMVADAQGTITLVNQQTEVLFGYMRDALLGKPVELLLPEQLRPVHRHHRTEYLHAPRTRPMGSGLALVGRRQDGAEFPIEVSLSPLPDIDSGPAVIATIRDISEVHRVQAANLDLRRLLHLTDTALAHLALDELLPELLGRVQDLLVVDTVVLLLLVLDPDGQQLQVYASKGLEEEVAAQVRIPVGQGFAGRIAATRAPLVVEDVSTFPMASPFLKKLRAALGVPLLLNNQLLGVLHVGTITPKHFTEGDVQLLQRAAERVAIALERAQWYAAEQQARQEAQAALARARASEARFERLVDSGIIGIVVGDIQHVIDANDAYLKLMGYTRADLQAGKLTRQVLSGEPEMVAASERAIGEAVATGSCQPFEREYVRKDGTRVPVLLGMVLLQRDPPLFVSFVVDLTEQKRAEAALRVSEDRLRLFVEHAPAAVAMFDRAMRYVSVSARWLQDYGLHGDVIGRSHYDLFPEIPERWKAIHRRCLAGAVERCEEDLFERLDGSTQWIWWEVRPWYSQPDVIGGIVIFAEDITARKQTEEELRASETNFRTLAENIPQLVWMARPDGYIFWYNQRWYDYTGMSAASQEGWGWESVHDPAVLPQVLERWRHSLASGEPFDMVFPLKGADGMYRQFLTRVVPVRDEYGVVVGWFGTNTDIEDQLRLEHEREESRANEVAAREVAKQLDQFFAMASHDIRGPVTTLSGYLDMACIRAQRLATDLRGTGGEDGAPVAPLVATLERANESSERLMRMVMLLFDVARARTGTLTLTLARCDVVALAREQVAAQQVAAPGRTIELVVPDRPVLVEADADRLGEVLTNFLTNALKYSADDQPVLVRVELDANQATVGVHDHGPGLPPEELTRVWDLHHRAPGVEVQGSVGTGSGSLGLGLHVCKRLVELHAGGQVGVESVVGEGSTFWFRLPLAPNEK